MRAAFMVRVPIDKPFHTQTFGDEGSSCRERGNVELETRDSGLGTENLGLGTRDYPNP